MPRSAFLLISALILLALGGCPRGGSSGGMMLGKWVAPEGCTIREIDAEPDHFTQYMRGGMSYGESKVHIRPTYDYSSQGYVYVKDQDSGQSLSYTTTDQDHIASDVDPACKYERTR